MDVFAHVLWTNAAYYRKYKTDWKTRSLSAFFGVLPDLCSFAPLFVYSFISRRGFWDLVNANAWVARYAHESYNYTHSLILFAFVALIVTLIRKGKVWWPMFGWALHILIDIPTHRGFYETPFLFPISDYKFSYGISWGEPTFMAVNYSALILTYIIIFILVRRKKA